VEEVCLSRILVVDDDSASRLVLKSRLGEQGFEVAIAESGARGLMEAREGAFDAFLVSADLSSGLPGWEVCRRIKGVPATSLLPVLLFSHSIPENDVLERGYEAGCAAFVAGNELPALEHVLRLALKQRRQLSELADEVHLLHEQMRRLQEERHRPHERENGSREGEDHASVLRELASGRPDGLMVVDAEGSVRQADRGASELLGMRLTGSHLGSLVPASGLEAFVRDARIEVREGFRFDLLPRKCRTPRSLSATVVPLVVHPGQHDPGLRVVLLYDAHKRKIAAEMLQVPGSVIPRQEMGSLREAARETFRPESLIGASSALASLRAAVIHSSQSGEPVLISGDPGTGKERIARTLHYCGSSTGLFLQIRCSALTPEDLDIELFGHAKGAFAGVASERPGLVHMAQDGTLYLEEVCEMQASTQQKLLRLLKEGTIQRHGAQRPERINVRIVASTSRPLDPLVQDGRFSRDLHQQFRPHSLVAPPLAGRSEDIVLLARHFVARFGSRANVHDFTDEALWLLRQHSWPGNVAELEDCIEQACARAQGGSVQADDLPRPLREMQREVPVRDIIPVKRPEGPLAQGTHSPSVPAHEAPQSTSSVPASDREPRQWDITEDDPVSFDVYEKKVLLRALHAVGGDKLAAARLLNVGKSTLYRKLKRYGIH
jgi:DNA-binding NtrC family response regulator